MDHAKLPPRITSREVAEILRVSPRTVEQRRRRKIGPQPVGGSRPLLYDRDEVLRLAGLPVGGGS